MRNLLSHVIFALSCPCTCARRAHTPSCTRSKIIAPVFLPSIDFSDLNLLVPSTSLPPAFVPGFWFFVSRESPLLWYNGSHLRPADATEQVRRQPRWRDQTCSLWSRISLSFFSPHTLSLFNTAPAFEAQPFFLISPNCLCICYRTNVHTWCHISMPIFLLDLWPLHLSRPSNVLVKLPDFVSRFST